MAGYSYSLMDRVGFYVSYLFYKMILPVEVRSPRFRLWWYELRYTLHKFRDYEYCLPWNAPGDVISTRFGSFKVRTGTADAANVSPAFERRDLNRLFRVTGKSLDAGKRVLFLDIGGDIGTYSVAVANRFISGSIDVICFEPIPDSCDLIRNNIERNGLAGKVELMETALMDERQDRLRICLNALAPGSSSVVGDGQEVLVQADRLDNLLANRMANYDALVMKIDVEGVEESVLRGATGLLEQGIETHLMVEDFIDRSIIAYLEQNGWGFEDKLTEYNSWWKKN